MSKYHYETEALKDSTAVLAAQTITSILSLSPGLMGSMMGMSTYAVNTIVTNMHGPDFAANSPGQKWQAGPVYHSGGRRQSFALRYFFPCTKPLVASAIWLLMARGAVKP